MDKDDRADIAFTNKLKPKESRGVAKSFSGNGDANGGENDGFCTTGGSYAPRPKSSKGTLRDMLNKADRA